MPRKLNSWLSGLLTYAEMTEAPRQFWYWGGISTIASALQRKVWLPFGVENYYPNLYILIIGPPASRKAAPISFSKKILMEIEVPVSVDSGSKRALTMELDSASDSSIYAFRGKNYGQCALSVISKEMSSLLAVNPKEMVEVLTDLYDSHDIWDYKTRGEGEDRLYNVCVNCFVASTPSWIMDNLPPGAIGGGYTSRNVIVYGDRVYKRVPRPRITTQMEKLYSALRRDLHHINNLVGPFRWEKEAELVFDEWYYRIDDKIKETRDARLHTFIGRMHAHVLKTAMCLQVEHSDELVLTAPIILKAIESLEDILKTASHAFGGFGASKTGPEIYRILTQIKAAKRTTVQELLQQNYQNTSLSELQEVLMTIEAMGNIAITEQSEGGRVVTWLGRKGVEAKRIKDKEGKEH